MGDLIQFKMRYQGCNNLEEVLKMVESSPYNKAAFQQWQKDLIDKRGLEVTRSVITNDGRLPSAKTRFLFLQEVENIGVGVFEVLDNYSLIYKATLDENYRDIGEEPLKE